jgi:hypothetical protein
MTCIIPRARAASVGRLRRPRSGRVDDHDRRPVRLRLADERPEVEVGDDGVGTPENDEPALRDVRRQHPGRRPDRRLDAAATARAANRPHEPGGAQPGKEAGFHTLALDQSHRAEVREGQDRRWAVVGGDLLQSIDDVIERLVPTDALESSPTLRPAAAHRIEEPIRAIDTLEVGVDLGAEPAPSDGVCSVADELDGDPIRDRDLPGAGIGAVMGTGAAHDRRGDRGNGGHGGNSIRSGRNRPAGLDRIPAILPPGYGTSRDRSQRSAVGHGFTAVASNEAATGARPT